ncbi:hypothetical protein Veis_2403 [Verminephrobacter eiseniae EF01-2]|uniref:Uncharacterized protein n=1 Tax=Verminephrobacter eiseniae (strain EF01-2) TaxID=391735 RepID=A1WKJ2_VEREI|nr:hypothetical protein Veis_2403 [Verminephrobacter eiseniae EF01-2]
MAAQIRTARSGGNPGRVAGPRKVWPQEFSMPNKSAHRTRCTHSLAFKTQADPGHLARRSHDGRCVQGVRSARRLVSRHRSDVVGCAQPSERSARRIACQYRAYWQAMQRRDALRWPARTDR